jgi:hypothetical protein
MLCFCDSPLRCPNCILPEYDINNTRFVGWEVYAIGK